MRLSGALSGVPARAWCRDAPSTAITDAAENSHKLARLKTLRNQLSSTAYY
jgi:hypothetical protein